MKQLQRSRLRPARITCAKPALLSCISSALRQLFWRPKGAHVRHLSDHLARDIGLGPAEMERHRHIWPSQSVDRSRI